MEALALIRMPWLLRIVLAGLLLGGVTGTRAMPNWPNVAYSYYARNEKLQDLLSEFAGGFSLALQLGPNVQGMVNGKFNANSPTEFLDRLGGVYGFNWFVYSGTLFVSRTGDMRTRPISAKGSSIGILRQALLQLGVLDSRFGWGELPDLGIALVSGPPSYVELVERTVAALPIGAGGQQVSVFRLKYASVNDRTVNYRDQKVVTPGLATTLRNLIAGGGEVNNEALAAMAAPLRNKAPALQTAKVGVASDVSGAPAVDPAATEVVASGQRPQGATVQADARLNAIIVQDTPDRIPLYRSLIEQLDQPSPLIEIQAMIVDVDSEQVNELGVTWGARAGGASVSSSGTGDALLPGTISFGIVGSNVALRLHALQAKGQANILSQPSILTADNLGAVIDLSSTFYIRTIGERVATLTPVTVGTSLRVTPRYIEAREGPRVELVVDIEDGQADATNQVGGLPTVRKSNISTQAVVGNGQTLLIGGYNNSQSKEQVDKVPVLGDIPLLGGLFSNKSKSVRRIERLILIRPMVVSVGSNVVATGGAVSSGVALNETWSGDGRGAVDSNLGLARGQRTSVLLF